MFISSLETVNQRRTLRPLYVNGGTDHDGFLDPAWDRSAPIYPGSVMTRLQGDLWTLYTGATGQKPQGLSWLFVAPTLGIDELRNTGLNAFAVQLGDLATEFEVIAPAFDPLADWTPNTDGSRKLLYVTKTAHASGPGLLTTTSTGNVSTETVAELIETLSDKKIRISLNRFA